MYRKCIRCYLLIANIPCNLCSINSCLVPALFLPSLVISTSGLYFTHYRMKSLLILAFLRALTAAQGIADLPPCSLSCLSTAVTGLGCSLTDFACSCQKASELTPIVTPCVQSACTDPADQAKTNAALAAICASVGSPIETSKPSSLAPEPTPTEPAAAEPTPVEPTTAPSSELPVETQPSATGEPGYSEYSASTSTTSEYAG